MSTILGEGYDGDLEIILDAEAEWFGTGGHPYAPIDHQTLEAARKRLREKFTEEETFRGLAWMTDKREGRSLREF